MKTKAEEAKLPKLLSDNYRLMKIRSIFNWLKTKSLKMKNFKAWNERRIKKGDKYILSHYFEQFFEEFQNSKQRKKTEKKIEKSIFGKFFTLWAYELNSRRKFR